VFRGGQRPLASARGITLLEVMLMMVVTTAIVAGLAPTLSATLGNARAVRATTDMNGIRTAIVNARADGRTRFTNNGTTGAASAISFLYSDGDIPEVGSAAAWQNTAADNVNDFLEEHLVLNSFNGGTSYPTGGGAAWRGAYINAPIDPDPWGNRYAVNVQYMGPSTNDVVVYSAGPDEEVDTTSTGNPLIVVDDDLLVLVEA